MIHESFARIQKQNEDLRLLVAELKMELPAQVSFRDLVEINDALGQTYSFPLSFVDSFEVCQNHFPVFCDLPLIPKSSSSSS